MIELTSLTKLKNMYPIIVDLKQKKNGKYEETTIIKPTTLEMTKELIDKRTLSVAKIAQLRGLTIGTIENHICQLVEYGKISANRYVPVHIYEMIDDLLNQTADDKLAQIKESNPDLSWLMLKVVKADRKRTSKTKSF
jgi:uncharacterized protein YpbB